MRDTEPAWRLGSHKIPREVTRVEGCDCGGLDYHRADCSIWGLGEQAQAAVDDARRRMREYSAALNAHIAAEDLFAAEHRLSREGPMAATNELPSQPRRPDPETTLALAADIKERLVAEAAVWETEFDTGPGLVMSVSDAAHVAARYFLDLSG